MTFKEICQTLLIQIDFLTNLPNFSHTKLSLFMVIVAPVKFYFYMREGQILQILSASCHFKLQDVINNVYNNSPIYRN